MNYCENSDDDGWLLSEEEYRLKAIVYAGNYFLCENNIDLLIIKSGTGRVRSSLTQSVMQSLKSTVRPLNIALKNWVDILDSKSQFKKKQFKIMRKCEACKRLERV